MKPEGINSGGVLFFLFFQIFNNCYSVCFLMISEFYLFIFYPSWGPQPPGLRSKDSTWNDSQTQIAQMNKDCTCIQIGTEPSLFPINQSIPGHKLCIFILFGSIIIVQYDFKLKHLTYKQPCNKCSLFCASHVLQSGKIIWGRNNLCLCYNCSCSMTAAIHIRFPVVGEYKCKVCWVSKRKKCMWFDK